MTDTVQGQDEKNFRQVVDNMQEYLNGMVKAGILWGYSCSFVTEKNCRIETAGFQGSMEPFCRRPVLPGMYYDLASLTKVVGTASRILQLIEEGKISFDTPVKSVLECFSYPDVTVGNLLLHNSGLMAEIVGKEGMTHENIMERVYETTMVFRPGERFLYSDTGFILLGLMVQKLDDRSLEESFQKYVLIPFT